MMNSNNFDSCSISVFSKNDFKDNQSNFDNISIYKYQISPIKKEGLEFEFPIKKPNDNSYRKEIQTKELHDKINHKDEEIKKMNVRINEMIQKIQVCDNENKKYERLIEKEESDALNLRHMLNFLNTNIN